MVFFNSAMCKSGCHFCEFNALLLTLASVYTILHIIPVDRFFVAGIHVIPCRLDSCGDCFVFLLSSKSMILAMAVVKSCNYVVKHVWLDPSPTMVNAGNGLVFGHCPLHHLGALAAIPGGRRHELPMSTTDSVVFSWSNYS